MSDLKQRMAAVIDEFMDDCCQRHIIDGVDLAEFLIQNLGLTRHDEFIPAPNATEFWHTWAMSWVRTCICTEDTYPDLACSVHEGGKHD